MRPENLSVRTAISEAVNAIRAMAGTRGVAIREGDYADVSVLADPLRLRQVLYNLLSNGVKFTPAGGEVFVDALREENSVRITVKDTGIGLRPEEHPAYSISFTRSG